MAQKPSQKLNDLLTGKTPWDISDQPIQSWAMFYVNEGANVILGMPKEKRRGALSRIPETVRPKVEQEMIRLHALRR